jgi:hypothetical protein
MFDKTSGVRMARVVPVSEQAFAVSRNAPKQPAVFQLGIFFMWNAVYQHDANLTVLWSQAIPRALPQRGKIIQPGVGAMQSRLRRVV